MASDKVLVDSRTDKIIGTYSEPIEFSISGMYVIDIPSTISVKPQTDNVNDFIELKRSALLAKSGLGFCEYDEFVNVSKVDSTSDGVIICPKKRTVVHPEKTIYTTEFTMTGTASKISVHFSGFFLYKDNTIRPPRMTYGCDNIGSGAFSTFQDSFLEVRLGDANTTGNPSGTDSNNLSWINPLQNNVSKSFGAQPNQTVYLKFKNKTNTPIYMSSWYFFWDNLP